MDVLADLAYRTTIDGFRDVTRSASEGIVHEQDGAVMWLSRHPMPFLVNGAARIAPSADAAGAVERAKAFFGERGRGFTFYGLAGRDDDAIAAAEAAGLVAFGDGSPLMAVEQPPTEIDVPTGVRIERAETADHVRDFGEVCSDAYTVYGMPDDVFPTLLTPETMFGPHRTSVVAYDDEGAIGGGFAIATHGCAYVCIIGVRQRAFKRGVGGAVTQAVTAAAFDLGARVATLMASPMGAPVYRRIGWSDVGVMQSRTALQ